MAHTISVINGKAPSGGTGGVSDIDLSNIAVNFFGSGVVGANDYQVTQNGTPNMSVNVGTGKAYVPNPAGTMLYNTYLDAIANVAISSNASGNPRIDAVVIKVDTATSPNSTASNVASIVVVQGTPAASPSAPSDSAIQSSVGAGNAFYRLANVTVANGAVSITTANIASTRSQVSLSNIGNVVTPTGTQTLTNKTISGSTNTITNIGTSSLTDANVTSRKMKLDQTGNAKVQSFATSSTTWTDVTGLSVTTNLNVASNALILVSWQASGTTNGVELRLVVDGTPDTYWIPGGIATSAGQQIATFHAWRTGYASGNHTWKVQVETAAGTITLQNAELTVIPFAS